MRAQSVASESVARLRSDAVLVLPSCVYIAQKVAGDHGFVLPLMLEKGRAKVIRPEILAGMVLEMGTGAKSAPKGGLQELIDAAEARKQRPEASGKFGEGPYKDEPWSIVALRKRVYAIRKFYEQTLVGEQATRENNPGWDDLVVNVLNSFALLLGTKPQHVPKVCGARRRACVRADGVCGAAGLSDAICVCVCVLCRR